MGIERPKSAVAELNTVHSSNKDVIRVESLILDDLEVDEMYMGSVTKSAHDARVPEMHVTCVEIWREHQVIGNCYR